MYCINCGYQLPDNAKYCLECATQQKETSKKGESIELCILEYSVDMLRKQWWVARNKSKLIEKSPGSWDFSLTISSKKAENYILVESLMQQGWKPLATDIDGCVISMQREK